MRRSYVSWMVLAVAACGGGQRATPSIGGRGGGPARAAALVYFPWGQDAVFEADCWAPERGGCAALRQVAEAGGELIDGTGRFQLTGRRDEECGASGDVASVVAYRRAAGGDDAYPGISVFPADADVGLMRHGDDGGAPWMPAVLAPRATADLVGTERARPIAASEIVVKQAVAINVTGDDRPDLLISAYVPLPGDPGYGYVWSALVLLPDGAHERPITLFSSDLEIMTVDASYDLDGDGRRSLIWTAGYYEGAASGAAVIDGDKLKIGATVGCGA